MASEESYDIPIHATAARRYHWLVAALLLIQFPLGLYMVYRGNDMVTVNAQGEVVKGLWDGLTTALYSSHKLLGLTILLLAVLRLGYRLTQSVPPPDATVPPLLTGLSHILHWSLYVLLIATPIIGYLAISYGNYLDLAGMRLPALTLEDKEFAKEIFEWHELAAKILAGLIVVHILGALYHRVIRKDRVVERMWPRRTNVG